MGEWVCPEGHWFYHVDDGQKLIHAISTPDGWAIRNGGQVVAGPFESIEACKAALPAVRENY